MSDTTRAYFVDTKHPPLVFAAVEGRGLTMEHILQTFRQNGLDVSPTIRESCHFVAVASSYEPPGALQIAQRPDHAGVLYSPTEIFGVSCSIDVLREVRKAAKLLDLIEHPLSGQFRKRIAAEQRIYVARCTKPEDKEYVRQEKFAALIRGMSDAYRVFNRTL